MSRRRFLTTTLAACSAPLILPSVRSTAAAPSRYSASERIGIGIIGVGGRGMNHVQGFMGSDQTQVLAVCDPYQSKRLEAKRIVEDHYGRTRGAGGAYKGCEAYSDFRAILDRKDIDAVAIASPENWHALQMALAAKAGKDIYGEKALSLTVEEGQVVCDAVRRYGRVFQVGTQQRSDSNFRFACELARNGYLGKIHTVKVGVPGGTSLPNAPPAPVPPGLDYEMWLGPAPYTPYNDIKCTYNWYFIRDYCVGWIQSWGVHHIDIALWGAPALGRGVLDIEGTAVFPTDGLADTSLTWRVDCFSKDTRLHFTDNSQNRQGVRFEGDRGWVHVDRGSIAAEPQSLLKVQLRPGDERLYESHDHQANFLECIRTRRDPVAPVEAGHAATTLTIISDIATRVGRKVVWDWSSRSFVKGDAANRMLRRPMRSPWTL
jgi:predicted dehydrogenase